jgi:hypothetical protein
LKSKLEVNKKKKNKSKKQIYIIKKKNKGNIHNRFFRNIKRLIKKNKRKKPKLLKDRKIFIKNNRIIKKRAKARRARITTK